MTDRPFAGKTVLVTGAFKRLGLLMARHFARGGARLVCHYFRSGEGLAERIAELESLGASGVLPFRADFSDPAALDGILPGVFAHAGTVDVLIHNASIYRDDAVESADPAHLAESLNVHALSPWALSRAFAAQAPERACIVSLLDAANPRKAGFFSYQMGKSLLVELTRQMAVAFGPRVRVNGLALGAFELGSPDDRSVIDAVVQGTPMARWGRPADLEQALTYLVTSDYVTGETLHLDGGLHLRRSGR